MLIYYIFLISFFLSCLFVFIITPGFIKKAHKLNFTGKDMNKLNKPLIAELGGIPVFFSFALTLCFIFLISFNMINIPLFLYILLTIFLIFLVGLTDDMFGWKKGIKQWQHFILPIIFSTPMVVYALVSNINSIHIPFITTISISWIYAWILVPLAITATSNAFNLLAGFNGFEAGMGIIILTTISIIALFENNYTLLIILCSWIGSLVGILYFNKYPAKIFVGDIVTLVNGVLIGISAIVLRLEFLIAFLVILYIIEFIIKISYKFKTECFGIPQTDGTIKPDPKGGSLTHIILKLGRFTEKKFVYTFYSIQVVISILTLLFYFL